MPAKPRKRRPLAWDDVQKQVLSLIFAGRKSQATIAQDCGVPLRTLEDWIAHPDFQAKLQERRDNLIASLDHKPYIRKERRLAALAEMAEAARQEYEARPWLQEKRQIGRDEDGEPLWMVNESFNRDAHAAFRDSLNDIAKELGERTNKVDATTAQVLIVAIGHDLLEAV